MKTLYFIRHGKTPYNETGRYIGSTDLSLSENGRKAIADKWQLRKYSLDIGRVYSSPMKRCIETADIIFPNMNPFLVEDIREMNFGIFEGKTYEDLKDNPYYIEFSRSRGNIDIPNGESGRAFNERMITGFNDIIDDMNKHNYDKSAIICHGGSIMALFAAFCDESDDIYHYICDNGSGYMAHFDEEKKKLIIIDKI